MHEKDKYSKMPTEAEFKSLVRRANADDQLALAQLRRTLDDNPVIWRRLGDMNAYAQRALIKAIAGGDTLLFESITREADEFRASLSQPSSKKSQPSLTKLEELAIERIVSMWLELQWIVAKHSSMIDASLPQARFNLRLLESASRRYDAAIRSLLLIRKSLLAAAESKKSRRAKAVG